MKLVEEIDSIEEFEPWMGGYDTVKIIRDHDCIAELNQLLSEHFGEKEITKTELNDFLWFSQDYILSQLGLRTKEDED